MDATFDDREVRAAFEQVKGVGANLTADLIRPLRRKLLAVQAAAQKLTPADGDRSLRRGAQTDVQAIGNTVRGRITFGGLASKYAEVQHENETFAHTPEEYAIKYGRPLDRNSYTRQTLRGKIGKRGKLTIKSKTWKYKRKRKITGYTGGQAHFLHGARNSAWNATAERELQEAVLRTATATVEKAISGREGSGP